MFYIINKKKPQLFPASNITSKYIFLYTSDNCNRYKAFRIHSHTTSSAHHVDVFDKYSDINKEQFIRKALFKYNKRDKKNSKKKTKAS